jgi:phosphoribosylanthranilate isomerase
MEASLRTRVKICCIASIEEAGMAIECGASALGLVSQMPSGPGVISEDRIAEVAAHIPPGITSFLLTCKQDTEEIIEQHRRCRTNCIQICDQITHGSHQKLRETLPGIYLVQVIHVTGPSSVEQAIAVAPHVNAVLLDSGNPSLSVKELGGTGRRHDWALSRAIREQVEVPVFLAGGLKPENVRAAIEEVGPFGLDVCSGVRTDGRLDREKLDRFFHEVHSARTDQAN